MCTDKQDREKEGSDKERGSHHHINPGRKRIITAQVLEQKWIIKHLFNLRWLTERERDKKNKSMQQLGSGTNLFRSLFLHHIVHAGFKVWKSIERKRTRMWQTLQSLCLSESSSMCRGNPVTVECPETLKNTQLPHSQRCYWCTAHFRANHRERTKRTSHSTLWWRHKCAGTRRAILIDLKKKPPHTPSCCTV